MFTLALGLKDELIMLLHLRIRASDADRWYDLISQRSRRRV